MDGLLIQLDSGGFRADMSIISLHRAAEQGCCGLELKYLHFSAIMDFFLCLRDRGLVQNHFWIKPWKPSADDSDAIVRFVCSAVLYLEE